MTSPYVIAQVKAATDLVSLVSGYVPLKKHGARWTGICPFHGPERTPSFGINADNFWKCFGCQAGGDCFTFLMKIDQVSFGEALKRLADSAGISLDAKPISRVAISYAKEEAECCRWWWARRHERMVAQAQRDYEGLED